MAEQAEHDLRQGAKAAAAAAAVAAAAGVARAIAAHARDASQPGEAAEPEEHAREAAEEPETAEESEESDEREEHEPVQGTGVDRVRAMTERARSILTELSSVEAESVSAVERTTDGWRITVEAVELRRIPDSTDVLATYEVELDGDGELVRYERGRRYSRSQSDDGNGR